MVERPDTYAEVVELVQTTLQPSIAIRPETKIAVDLGLDSVAVMDFVMELEDRFDISIPLDRIAEIETIADLVTAVDELKGLAEV